MGGLAPGIGGLEFLIIGLVALLVVGPKDLPVLLRRLGQFTAKARAMASDFRASFDEMARQSELDELKKEVQALRSGQNMLPLGAEAETTFKEIADGMREPFGPPTTRKPTITTPAEVAPMEAEPVAVADEWPDPLAPWDAQDAPVAAEAVSPGPKPARARKPRTPKAAPEPSPPAPARTARKAATTDRAAKPAAPRRPRSKPAS